MRSQAFGSTVLSVPNYYKIMIEAIVPQEYLAKDKSKIAFF